MERISNSRNECINLPCTKAPTYQCLSIVFPRAGVRNNLLQAFDMTGFSRRIHYASMREGHLEDHGTTLSL